MRHSLCDGCGLRGTLATMKSREVRAGEKAHVDGKSEDGQMTSGLNWSEWRRGSRSGVDFPRQD